MKRSAEGVCTDETCKNARPRIGALCEVGTIRVFDEKHRVIDRLDTFFGYNRVSIAMRENGDFYLHSSIEGAVKRINPNEPGKITSYHCGGFPCSFYYDRVGEKLVVPLYNKHKVVFLELGGKCIASFDCLEEPRYACVDRGNRIVISSLRKLQILAEDGKELLQFGLDRYTHICGLEVNKYNQLLVCDGMCRKVDLYKEDFQLQKTFNLNFVPAAMTIDCDTNEIYMANQNSNKIVLLDGATGNKLSMFDASSPWGLCLAPWRRWTEWKPWQYPSNLRASPSFFVRAWCISVQKNQGPLAALPRDLAIREIAQYIFNQ